jgi:hypothetical protein
MRWRENTAFQRYGCLFNRLTSHRAILVATIGPELYRFSDHPGGSGLGRDY